MVLLHFKEQRPEKRVSLLSQFKGLLPDQEFVGYLFKKGKRSFSHTGVVYSSFQGRGPGRGCADAGHRSWLLEDRGTLTDKPWPALVFTPHPKAQREGTGLHRQRGEQDELRGGRVSL